MSDASSIGLALVGPENGRVGERVIVYVDGPGRIEGEIVRHLARGFAMKVIRPSRAAEAIDRLAKREPEPI